MAREYIQKDLAGYWFNAKYPPDYAKNGTNYNGYKSGKEEILFYDFAVQGYDLSFVYKGKSYHFLTDLDHVAYCDEMYTEEYQRFEDGNSMLEQFLLDGEPIIRKIDELEDVEAV